MIYTVMTWLIELVVIGVLLHGMFTYSVGLGLLLLGYVVCSEVVVQSDARTIRALYEALEQRRRKA